MRRYAVKICNDMQRSAKICEDVLLNDSDATDTSCATCASDTSDASDAGVMQAMQALPAMYMQTMQTTEAKQAMQEMRAMKAMQSLPVQQGMLKLQAMQAVGRVLRRVSVGVKKKKQRRMRNAKSVSFKMKCIGESERTE